MTQNTHKERVLRDIMDHPGDSYAKIAARLGLSRQAVCEWMAKLDAGGLIDVQRGPGRILPGSARLTPQGVALALGESFDANGSPVEGE